MDAAGEDLLKDRVRNKEDRKSSIVSSSRHRMAWGTKTGLQSIDLGIADVGSVKEGEEVEDTQLLGRRLAFGLSRVYLSGIGGKSIDSNCFLDFRA